MTEGPYLTHSLAARFLHHATIAINLNAPCISVRSMSTGAKPRRFRFRFTLRTLFVLLSAFGIWLGVQVKWVQDRQDARKWIKARGYYLEHQNPDDPRYKGPFYAPLGIRLLGEHGVGKIYIDKPLAGREDEFERLKTLFPEAEVFVQKLILRENVPAYRRIGSAIQ